jgi:hypothetical protein
LDVSFVCLCINYFYACLFLEKVSWYRHISKSEYVYVLLVKFVVEFFFILMFYGFFFFFFNLLCGLFDFKGFLGRDLSAFESKIKQNFNLLLC